MMNKMQCDELYGNFTYYSDTEYCTHVFDEELCWPPTQAGTNVTKLCPRKRGIDPTKYAYRICGLDGHWDNNNNSLKREQGYTYYDNCYLPGLKSLIKMCQEISVNVCMEITQRTRLIEMIGLGLSLISLLISLIIFYRYRILRNNRTSIHKNLFKATLLQVLVRLLIYVDQSFAHKFIENTQYLCEACYALLEYTKTSMFMWMFIEGLYLHNVITVTVFQEYSYMTFYFWIGWGIPIVLTFAWIVTMVFTTENTVCWNLYYFLPYYWILEGPRCGVICVNMLFLLSIIRVLVVKLRESHTSEIEQARKAVKAAVFLLPLMGIANILFLVDFRLFRKAWKFALWSYSTYFLTTFQGFFVAVLYCFLNGEVKDAVKNSFQTYKLSRNCNNNVSARRNSALMSGFTAFEVEQ